MKFSMFQWIGKSVDAMMSTFITQTASNVILGFQLLILTGVTLYVTLTGYAIATGAVEQPLQTFIKQCIKISIIAAFVMTADSYTSTVVSAMEGLESGLAGIAASPDAQSENIYEVLDKSVDTGLDVAYKTMGRAANRKLSELGKMLWDLINGALMAIAVFMIHLPAAATIIVAKLGLNVLLGIGPLFIAALMFPITAPWFDKWFQQAMAFILEIAIVMVVASTGVGLYGKLYERLVKTGDEVPITTSIEIIILALIVLSSLKKNQRIGCADCRRHLIRCSDISRHGQRCRKCRQSENHTPRHAIWSECHSRASGSHGRRKHPAEPRLSPTRHAEPGQELG